MMDALETRTLLLCRVGEALIALPLDAVREVLPLLPLWRPPTLPAPLAGMVEVRGEVLPVLALGVLFGQGPDDEATDLWAHMVRPVGQVETVPCLLVDRVEEVVTVSADAIRAIAVERSFNGVVAAEVALGDRIAHLVALDRLLDEGERAQVATLTRDAARRAALWSVPEPA